MFSSGSENENCTEMGGQPHNRKATQKNMTLSVLNMHYFGRTKFPIACLPHLFQLSHGKKQLDNKELKERNKLV